MKIAPIHDQSDSDLPRLFFTRLEAAKVAGISLSTLDRETKANRIPHKRIRGRVLYPKPVFIKWCSCGDGWLDGMGVAA